MLFGIALCIVGLSFVIKGAEISSVERDDTRRPFYNIAHMVNGIVQINQFLDKGANAIEFDIEFDANGTAQHTHHGFPCDCGRKCFHKENVTEYLNHIRQVTTPGDPLYREQLVLLAVDLKLQRIDSQKSHTAGVDVAKKLLDHYWQRGKSKARAYLLLNLPLLEDYEFVRGFKETLKDEGFEQYNDVIGINFTGNEDLNKTREVYEELNVNSHIWQSDGITSCFARRTKRLEKVLKLRNDPNYNYVTKVYPWTIVRYTIIRRSLRFDVDGIQTNLPHRVSKVLKEKEFASKFRLATYEDDPWKKFIRI
uniref:Loxtox protein n=1 Tax=Loxosceles similis TaxID=321804 RepID=A0A1B2ASF6_LOXSM|nr:loxtox protein [Loxosceles similis]